MIRETIISQYKKYEIYIRLLLKFIFGLIIFSYILKIGYVRSELSFFLPVSSELPYLLLMAVLYVILPHTISLFLMIANITIQISLSTEIALIVFLVLLCLLLLYARLAPKENILILATVFAFYFNLQYAIPIIAGLYFGVTSVIPIAIGIFIWEYIPVVNALVTTTRSAGLNIMEMPGTFAELYVSIINIFSSSQQWIFESFIFAMVVLTVYAVSRLGVNYAKELAITLGAVINFISFIIANIIVGLEINLLSVTFLTLLAAAVAFAIRFFDSVLDYQRAETVQFYDEENYYYVRVIPKMILPKRKRVVKRIQNDSEL